MSNSTIFWQLFKESVILQAILTLGIWGAVIYLALADRAIPDVMLGAANLVMGFYFGSKLAMAKQEVKVVERRSYNEEV